MDISFYTLANALGITCAAAAFLLFLRRTARGQAEKDDDTDAPPEQSDAQARQAAPHAENADHGRMPESVTDADRAPAAPRTETGNPADRRS